MKEVFFQCQPLSHAGRESLREQQQLPDVLFHFPRPGGSQATLLHGEKDKARASGKAGRQTNL